ncbi:MAG: hypothetical protein Q4B63_10685 [Clostridium perfringens]|nr:hypothetical protein [Clostridium perfringens]
MNNIKNDIFIKAMLGGMDKLDAYNLAYEPNISVERMEEDINILLNNKVVKKRYKELKNRYKYLNEEDKKVDLLISFKKLIMFDIEENGLNDKNSKQFLAITKSLSELSNI